MRILLLYIFLLMNGFAAAQNAVAELKFEEAEIAFNNRDFEKTIEKVNEFEKVLGGMTDKSLYLRIVSQKNLFNPYSFYADEEQYNLYVSLDNNIKKYLKATEKNGLDDKFKEIYAEGESLKKMNLTKDKKAWLKEKKRREDETEARRKYEEELREECKNNFKEYTLDSLRTGVSIEEFQAQYPDILTGKYKSAKVSEGSQGSAVYIYYSKNINFEDKRNFVFPYNATTGKPIYDKTVHAVFVQDGTVVGFQKQVLYYNSQGEGNLDMNSAQAALFQHIQEQKDTLQNCANDIKYSSPEGQDMWSFDGKNITLFRDVYKDEKGKRWKMSLTTRVLKTK